VIAVALSLIAPCAIALSQKGLTTYGHGMDLRRVVSVRSVVKAGAGARTVIL